eukprot:3785319-Rhodomonas_salina.2
MLSLGLTQRMVLPATRHRGPQRPVQTRITWRLGSTAGRILSRVRRVRYAFFVVRCSMLLPGSLRR